MESSEEWRDIPTYEGRYMVSSEGRVKSLPKEVVDPDGRVRKYGERILKLLPTNKYGHLKVGLYLDGVQKEFLVHRLVLTSFVRPPKPGEECLHNNGVPKDNRLSNLRWGTSKENSDDCARHGKIANGDRLPQTKLCKEDVTLIIKSELPNKELSEMFGVSARHIRSIKSGKYWKWLKEEVTFEGN